MTKQQAICIAIYLILLVTCVLLILTSNYLSLAARDVVLRIAELGFTTAFGAIIGALSAMWGANTVSN